ncbi:hypothetical protein Pfo_004978 [Paulownia fortunei]|nr:hypothetical protein Pfo_004978 [Paulownia fortunei]
MNDGAKTGLSGNSSFDQISPSTSIMHQNMGFTVSQIGMIFGNLPFEPSLAIPVIVHGHESQEPKLKSEVVVADDDHHCAIGFQDHFYCGTSLMKTSTSSVLEGGMFQIKQEYDCQQTSSEAGKPTIWDPNKVQKKKRSKLPQYTLSPLARFINQLHHVSQYRPNLSKISTASQRTYDRKHPKYDDVLIYEKCKYVADNEIGLGAKLLSQPFSSTKKAFYCKQEYSSASTTSSSTNGSDAYFNCLIDVPIRSSPSE